MALSPTKLADALDEHVGNQESEADARDGWASALVEYFKGAKAGAIAINPASVDGAKGAISAAMLGMSEENQGALSIQAGFVAFWALATNPLTTSGFFPGVLPLSVPPVLTAGIAAKILAKVAVNAQAGVTKKQALLSIATEIHPQNLGGTVTIPGVPPLVVAIA